MNAEPILPIAAAACATGIAYPAFQRLVALDRVALVRVAGGPARPFVGGAGLP